MSDVATSNTENSSETNVYSQIVPSVMPNLQTGQKIEAAKWLQGSFFKPEDSARLQQHGSIRFYSKDAELQALQSTSLWMVISQSCDLVHAGSEEPTVEILILITIEKSDSRLQNLKNPRRIQLSKNQYETAAHWRLTLSRETLTEYLPNTDSQLDETDLRTLRRWLARRYKRAAFAGEFENRWKQASKEDGKKVRKLIEDLLNRINNNVEMILVLGNAIEELPKESNYEISFVVIMHSLEDEEVIIPNPKDKKSKPQKLSDVIKEFSDHLNHCPGIVVADYELQVPTTVSYATIKNGLVWDADTISDQENLETSDEDD